MVKKLCVKMLGGFSASYGDEVLTFGRQKDSKLRQLFQILMTRPGRGFSKSEIAKSLYGWEEVEDTNASLNNIIFRLRKYLETSPLPSDEYLLLSEGVLRFDGGEIEIESDAWSFECAAKEFDKEQDRGKKAELCKKGWELYQGEFLPDLSNEQWVIEKGRNYQKLYFKMLKYLLCVLKEEGDHRGIERVSARAAQLYPYEGWEIWQIESMMALERYKEAEGAYRKIAEDMQKTGGLLSKRQQERFRELGNKLQQPEGTAEDINKCLMEPVPGQGAYACTFLSFLDCFRVLKRVIDRGENRFSLILWTILDANGHPANDQEYCRKLGEKLCASFHAHMRRGDVYTKYSENQYLLLCIGAESDNVADIGTRIDMDFRKRYGGRGGIGFQLLDDGNIW